MKLNYTVRLLLSLFVLISTFSSCSKGDDAPVDTFNPETDVREITVTGSVEIDDLTDLSIQTIENSSSLADDNFSVSITDCNSPQLILVNNSDDEIVMLSRDFYSSTSDASVNVESSALALVTMHPVLAPITRSEYELLKRKIKESPNFSALCDEVELSINNRNYLFSSENTNLMLALSNVFDDLCSEVPTLAQLSRSSSITRSGVDVESYPIEITPMGSRLKLQNTWLAPSYYGSVYNENGDKIKDLVVPTRNDYGAMDLFLVATSDLVELEDLRYGDPVYYQFNVNGGHRFEFTRTSAEAMLDLGSKIAQNLANATIPIAADEIKSLQKIIVDNYGLLQSQASEEDVIAFLYDITSNYFLSKTDIKENTSNYVQKLLQTVNIYTKIKGTLNGLFRIAFGVAAPNDVKFCLNHQNGNLTSCSHANLYVKSGNYQYGHSGQRLLVPIVVTTIQGASNDNEPTLRRIKFSVESGNGTIANSIVNTNELGEAETYWTLGTGAEGDTQTVKAVVVDMATNEEISEPVIFSATVTKMADITIRLDWNKLSGKTDIDLHVIDPYGERIYYRNMNSTSGGELDRDDVVGPGPEHVTWHTAPEGVYTVKVHYYGSDDGAITTYSVAVSTGGTTYQLGKGSI